MSAPAAACAALEVALNRYLALEPDALARCAALAGKRLALVAPVTNWTFHVELMPHGVRVAPDASGDADVTVHGSLTALLALARTPEGRTGLPPGLQVEGDSELLMRFREILAMVGFDFAEWLAPLLGDAAAHRAAEFARSLFGWGRNTASTLSLNTAEYLREETGDLVHRIDAEQWMDAVDDLRDRAERLAARIAGLEQRRDAGADA